MANRQKDGVAVKPYEQLALSPAYLHELHERVTQLETQLRGMSAPFVRNFANAVIRQLGLAEMANLDGSDETAANCFRRAREIVNEVLDKEGLL